MKSENIDIRFLVLAKKLEYKDIARQMEITPEYLCRVMGKPLSLEHRSRILNAIDQLTRKGG